MSNLHELWKNEEQKVFEGWDFSYLKDKIKEEKPNWDYKTLALGLIREAQSLLDIATGGGEFLSSLAPLPTTTFAIEGYEPNVKVAKQKLEPLGVKVLYVKEQDDYPFDDKVFDLVINRHGGLNLSEVYRVLKTGGRFLTQQVASDDLSDLREVFETKAQFSQNTLASIKDSAIKLGFQIKNAEEWKGKTTFVNVASIVYFLKAIPFIIKGFSVDTHLRYLNALQEKLNKGDDLTFTVSRFLLLAKK
jgi:SAM-dependent methyltransferase